MTAPALADRGWRDLAACRGEDPDLFFAEGSGTVPAVALQHDQAKAVCRRCPVAADCLRFAVAFRIEHGVFGGSTPDERNAAHRHLTKGAA